MTTGTKDRKQPKLLPAPNCDFYELYETLDAASSTTTTPMTDRCRVGETI